MTDFSPPYLPLVERKVTFAPLYDHVLILPGDVEKKKGMIIVPDTAQDLPAHGVVIAVGEGKLVGDTIVGLRVKVGDKIIFGKYSGNTVAIDGVDHVVVREGDILGVLHDA